MPLIKPNYSQQKKIINIIERGGKGRFTRWWWWVGVFEKKGKKGGNIIRISDLYFLQTFLTPRPTTAFFFFFF